VTGESRLHKVNNCQLEFIEARSELLNAFRDDTEANRRIIARIYNGSSPGTNLHENYITKLGASYNIVIRCPEFMR